MKCPYCQNADKKKINKNGKYKNTQRYKCLKCKRTFKDKNYDIKFKKEKELATALLNLVKLSPNNFDSTVYKNLNLSEMLANEKIDEKDFKNVSVKIKKALNDHSKIECINPRAVLCIVENEIRIILLPQYYQDFSDGRNKGIDYKLFGKPDPRFKYKKKLKQP